MSCQGMEELLNEYVDQTLADDKCHEVERHIDGCQSCRETLASLRSLRAEAAALPKTIVPARDLWPQIRARIGTTTVAREGSAGSGPFSVLALRSARSQWALAAAAAMVLVVFSAAVTSYLLTGGAGVIPVSGVSAGATSLVVATLDEFRPAEADYALAIDELTWALEERRDSLDADTITVIETNLRVIDAAIRRARAALEDHPGSPKLARILSNNYRIKLDLLERANNLVERS
ncbi:MAG: anti-sigma factor family protein [Acidobacteriota bacterium]